MPKKVILNKQELEILLKDRCMTYLEIATLFGCTRQYVWRLAKQYGLSTVERFDIPCAFCDKPVNITRARYRANKKRAFCNQDCYHKYNRQLTENRAWRQEQRIARTVMEEHLGYELSEGHVIHHLDGDQTNNLIDNLIVFISHSEHMRFHHVQRQYGIKIIIK
jgi:hypothetical protein